MRMKGSTGTKRRMTLSVLPQAFFLTILIVVQKFILLKSEILFVFPIIENMVWLSNGRIVLDASGKRKGLSLKKV